MTVASSPAPAANRSPATRRRRWPIVLACLLGLAAVPVAGYLYLARSADRELEMAIEEVDRVDPRWRFDDWLADRKPIPDAENPAVVIAKANVLLGPGSFYVGEKNHRLFESLTPVNRLNGPQVAALRAAFTRHAEAVKLARTLKELSGEGRFAIRHSLDHFSTDITPLQRGRTVVDMLRYDAMLRAEDDDAAGAIESCRALLSAARAIGDEPFLFAAQVRFSEQTVAVNALERSLAQGEPPADQLQAMQDLLAREIDATFFLQALRGERGDLDRMLVGVQRGKVKITAIRGGGSWDDWLLDAFPSMVGRGRAEHLRLSSQAVAAARLPVEQQGEAFDKVVAAGRASKTVVARTLMGSVAKVAQENHCGQANLRCALVGVALERYRLNHVKWPASLSALVTDGLLVAVPLDPFDGQPLRYKLVQDGVIVYSVGLDGVDNGGAIDRDNPNQPGTDLGFRLWSTAFRRQ